MADDERVEREAPRRAKPRRERSAKDRERRPPEPSGVQLVAGARRQLAEITGMEAGLVTSLERSDDDGWRLSLELVELSRVPRAADVLGVYDVKLDAASNLLSYRRVRRYSRGETRGDE
jgi:hypothetical protein